MSDTSTYGFAELLDYNNMLVDDDLHQHDLHVERSLDFFHVLFRDWQSLQDCHIWKDVLVAEKMLRLMLELTRLQHFKQT